MENICTLNSVVLSMYYSVLHGKKQAHFRAFCTFFSHFSGKSAHQKGAAAALLRAGTKTNAHSADTGEGAASAPGAAGGFWN